MRGKRVREAAKLSWRQVALSLLLVVFCDTSARLSARALHSTTSDNSFAVRERARLARTGVLTEISRCMVDTSARFTAATFNRPRGGSMTPVKSDLSSTTLRVRFRGACPWGLRRARSPAAARRQDRERRQPSSREGSESDPALAAAVLGSTRHRWVASQAFYLARYAQESAWREDHRRADNGAQVRGVVALALKRGRA